MAEDVSIGKKTSAIAMDVRGDGYDAAYVTSAALVSAFIMRTSPLFCIAMERLKPPLYTWLGASAKLCF